MPKTKKSAVKPVKQKLTPEQRSQVAKDRWAKRKADKAAEEIVVTINTALKQDSEKDIPAPHVVEQEPSSPSVVSAVASHEASIADLKQAAEALKSALPIVTSFVEPPAPPAPPVKAPKQKRTPVPKEFLVALRTADTRLAKAIEEYEDCQQRITYLSAAIPRLQRTVLALRNESNPDALTPSVPPAFGYPTPAPIPQFQPQQDPLAAILAAQPQPPISKASGGAIQFSPADAGALEGPEDEDEDMFLKGGGVATEGKWV
jgi:hypothetical protein